MPTTTWELHHPHRRVHRLPILVIALVVLPYCLQLLSVPISDEGYQRHLHAWGPRPRETRECTDVAYPRKCAELNGERGVANSLSTLITTIPRHRPASSALSPTSSRLRCQSSSRGSVRFTRLLKTMSSLRWWIRPARGPDRRQRSARTTSGLGLIARDSTVMSQSELLTYEFPIFHWPCKLTCSLVPLRTA